MKTSEWKHAAVVCALVCTPIGAQATTISYTGWASPGILSFSPTLPPESVPPDEDQVIPDTLAEYVWYCGPTGAGCSGTNSYPNMVEFRYEFYLEDSWEGNPLFISDAYLSIAADDYYALYVNGNLLTPNGVWHEDDPDTAKEYDLTSSLELGASNEILIFACDGYPKSSGAKPGVTPAGGWDGCKPTDRVNNWLLTDGQIIVVYDYPDFDLASGYPFSNWEVRGATVVPEPSAVSLFLLGAMGGLLLHGKRKRRAQE